MGFSSLLESQQIHLGYEKLDKPDNSQDSSEYNVKTKQITVPEGWDVVCFSEEFEETWEDAQCLATVWLGASIGSLLLSIHGPYLATVSGFLGILGFASFLTPRLSSRITKSLWPSMLMAATTAFLSSIIAGFCLGYLVALHRGCSEKAGECQMHYEIFLFNFCWYAFTTAISVAVFRELSSLKDIILSMRERFECAQQALMKTLSI